MDIQSAIENFKRAREIYLKDFGRRADAIDLYDTAISAMQELQRYRQIGTIKEFRECKEIIGKAEVDELAAIIDGYLEYRKIGTPEECREAMEKQKAQKVFDVKGDKLKFGTCPACSRRISDVEGGNYCQNCGQAIDWSDEE